jgi:hypothetical protein
LPYFGARFMPLRRMCIPAIRKDFMNFFEFDFMPEIECFSMKDV